MTALPDGYAAVPGRSQATALALLAAADAVGVDQTLVRTRPFGDEYHVPQEVADYYREHTELSADEVAAVQSPRVFRAEDGTSVGSEKDIARLTEGAAGGPGFDTLAGGSTEVEKQDENPVPAKSASKGDWLDYAVSIEAAKFEASEETPVFDGDEFRKQLEDASTKDQLIEKYGA